MTTDIEVAKPGGEVATLDEVKAAERSLWVAVFFSSVVAIPICVGIQIGMVALALAISDTSQGFAIPLAVAAGVGVIAGVFFGGWAGFLAKSHVLDEIDGRAGH